MPTPHYGQPRYRTIADELRHRIENGIIQPGALLPAESTLTAEFQASRGTIRQAIAALREEQLVTTEHGRGTYAHTPQHKSRIDKEIETETLQRQIPADPELASLFEVELGTALFEEQILTRRNGAVETVTRLYRVR
ncbi:GntR family transcriptional regulator [Micromonospora wenchangensis]|uniref:GntR family transcriptional regulator n=1 Tax=Micromonospora wenchangensis TaxID=1185415 RepID=UPI0034404DF9